MSSLDRKCHCLKREKGLAIPRHLLFFDIETNQNRLENGSIEQTFKLGWACYYRKGYGRNLELTEWCFCDNAETFWQFVKAHTAKKQKLWVLARNLVFDFTMVKGWKYLREAGFKLKFFHDSGCTSIISVKGEWGSIVFLDIMNWFVESLAKTGQRLGIPKLKIDFDTCSNEYLSIYCKRDIEIELENFKLFIKFLEDNHVSRLCYTRGSTAMAAYLFSHYNKRIYIHNNKEATDLERDSYRGGRTECFYIGELSNENYYTVDVNSLYPFVMCNNLYPVKYKKISKGLSRGDLQGLVRSFSLVANVLIETDEPVYAVRRKRTVFPIGRFWVVLTTPELKYALEHNHIKAIDRYVLYEQADIFKSYVTRFYKLRMEFKKTHNAEYEELCKKMLNSLYGKFGQKADVWEKIGDCPNEKDRVELCFEVGISGITQIRYLLGEIFRLKGYKESFNSFPAIPAHVAAFGRVHLWRLMKQAGKGNYFYCDTDSLIINDKGLYNLQNQINKTELGYLKIEDTMNHLTIRGLKDYSTPTKTVIKGVRKSAIEIRAGVFQQEQWPSFKGLLRDTKNDIYTVKKVTKTLSRIYTKGIVMNNGTVEPLSLFETAENQSPLF